MRILVISDTHIPSSYDELPPVIEKEARASDCCLHCGDFVSHALYTQLSSWTKTYGVCGNMDDDKIRSELPLRQILEFEGFRIALSHGGGHPARIIDYISREFESEKDISLYAFGHSHCALNEVIAGKVYFNPGSPTDQVFAAYRSYGILEIEAGEIKRRILKIG